MVRARYGETSPELAASSVIGQRRRAPPPRLRHGSGEAQPRQAPCSVHGMIEQPPIPDVPHPPDAIRLPQPVNLPVPPSRPDEGEESPEVHPVPPPTDPGPAPM
jgi:hypothetical protein